MTIRATCDGCGKDFYFQQLYRAAQPDEDRCPNCHQRLGILHLRHNAMAADLALAELTATLRAITQREPTFSISSSSLLAPLVEAARRAADPPVTHSRTRRRRRRSAPQSVA
jgi:hypothetical protein